MDSKTHTLQIDLLGTSFTIKVNSNPERLEKLLSYYKRIVKSVEQKGSLDNPLQIAIMAGLIVCDEAYKEKEAKIKVQTSYKSNKISNEADRITKDLIQKIDEVL